MLRAILTAAIKFIAAAIACQNADFGRKYRCTPMNSIFPSKPVQLYCPVCVLGL
jgi:hypothetical protein